MDDDMTYLRLKLRNDFPLYANQFLKVRSKADGIVHFKLNRVQQYIHEKVEDQRRRTGKVRAIILKGRQQGCSTYIGGRFYWLVSHHLGKRVFILTHDHDATNNLFEFANRFHTHLPDSLRPHTSISNIKEIYFDELDSGYKVGTAGNKAVGRSATIQYLHGSEVAYWPSAEEHAKGILQAVPDQEGTEIFLESTANGIGNYFHEQWQLSESRHSEFMPIFLPWYWQEEYVAPLPHDWTLTDAEVELKEIYQLSDEQLAWRRIKLSEYGIRNAERAFKQEYPCCAQEAFQTSGGETFISPPLVLRARQNRVEGRGPLIIGCDPAGSGEDRTAIIRRRGRNAYNLQVFEHLETTEICGILHKIIEKEHPFKVCIDSGTFGIGIVDRLKELGHECVWGVNSAIQAFDQDKYFNQRCEMWGEMKLWLQDDPVQIPDDDSLHSDLCSYNYDESEHTDGRGRLKLEPKVRLKARHIRSPDCADALALTFSVPRSAFSNYNKSEVNHVPAMIMSQFNKVKRARGGRFQL